MIRPSVLQLLLFGFAVLQGPIAMAQGLIFELPEDGSLVEYEGTLTQGVSADDENPLSWDCELSIKSVGKTDEVFEGVMQPCRWIEIRTMTGKSGAAGLDPGLIGSRIYKVLVPESKIIADNVDGIGIPNEMLPILRGWRRIGEDKEQQIRTSALRFYPTITLLTTYPEITTISTNAVPEIKLQSPQISAVHRNGNVVLESPTSRSTNTADFWVSKDVPFGLARWTVTITTEKKDLTAPRSDFQTTVVKTLDMQLRRIDSNAESELGTE
jgi:hypothetical protein